MKQRVFAISDIHGCYDRFREMVEQHIVLSKSDKLILLGDYIDRGTNSKEVIDYIIALQKSGYDVIPLMGNHEAMLLDALADPSGVTLWFVNGGHKTMQSFGISRLIEFDPYYIDFFRNLNYYYAVENFLFVHAGFNDSIEDPFSDRRSMLWESRQEYQHPLLKGKTIIHGHQTIKLSSLIDSIDKHARVINIDTGCVYAHPEEYGRLTAFEINSFSIVSI
ncbi:MAG: serine/threonine protein phosphatase [Lentimicrobium sp.]|nr:serine/threonine protein phosphatase [Lentimicrobium sp.]